MRLLYFTITTGAMAAAKAAYVPGKAFDRFITIWLENEDFAKASENAHLKALMKEGILLTNYFGHTHPSQPNYIASVGGDYFGMNHDNYITIPENISTVVDLFDTRDIEWKGYFEGLPGPGFMGVGSTALDRPGWDYVRKHNPFISYDSISHNGTRLAQIQSFREFANDVTANTLPQYAHMSPNMLNDGHNTSLEYAANWTESFLTPLLRNKDFMEKTLVLLTYDESATYEMPNKIVSILLGGVIPSNKKGTSDNTFYTHYSILATMENNWDLPCLGRYDVGANVFELVAQKTGYANHPPSNVASVNNSLSYPGFLNDDPALWKPIPPPNLQLVGAGGQGVEESIAINWKPQANEPSPYDGSGNVYDGGNGKDTPNGVVYNAQGPAPSYTASGTGTATEPTAVAPVETKKSSGSRIGPLDGRWVGVGIFGIMVFCSI